MKFELKENMHVRTKDGEIHKIKSINDEYIKYENGFGIPYESKEYIVKASYNIIDILEVGDYVNGKKIYSLGLTIGILNTINFEDGTFTIAEDIKSVITHEQMEQMAYKVEE